MQAFADYRPSCSSRPSSPRFPISIAMSNDQAAESHTISKMRRTGGLTHLPDSTSKVLALQIL